MVSVWWLLVAFWLGGCLGMLLMALLAASGKSEREDEDAPSSADARTPLHRRS